MQLLKRDSLSAIQKGFQTKWHWTSRPQFVMGCGGALYC